MAALLQKLVVLTIRYQTVGRRRTGLLEIACAKASKDFSSSDIALTKSLKGLEALTPTDSDFIVDFERYRERNSKRAIHILLGIESVLRHGAYEPDWVNEVIGSEQCIVAPLISKNTPNRWPARDMGDPAFVEDVSRRIGNLFLFTREEARAIRFAGFDDVRLMFSKAEYKSTFAASTYLNKGEWGRKQIMERQAGLAKLAVQCWSWEQEA